jgi:hypothetical protein
MRYAIANLTERRWRLAPAAIHESAHELVAHKYGCTDVHPFLRNREEGVCYSRLPRRDRWDADAARWKRDDLAPIRARAAIDMSGWMAEELAEGGPVSDYETLLMREGPDPLIKDRYDFTHGALEECFLHATAVFGDHHDAADWLEAALPGVHHKTERLLRSNWHRGTARAETLERKLAA